MGKYNTQFFERYARFTLIELLGNIYEGLVNKDRPDLQDEKSGIGIEVTRSMEENKSAAKAMVYEMSGKHSDYDEQKKKETRERVKATGYSYGLRHNGYIGDKEYDYWSLAKPLLYILDNKVKKVTEGFYGEAKCFGLYIFTRHRMSDDEVRLAMDYVANLQKGYKRYYKTLFISEIHELNVCDMGTKKLEKYSISEALCKKLFEQSL